MVGVTTTDLAMLEDRGSCAGLCDNWRASLVGCDVVCAVAVLVPVIFKSSPNRLPQHTSVNCLFIEFMDKNSLILPANIVLTPETGKL